MNSPRSIFLPLAAVVFGAHLFAQSEGAADPQDPTPVEQRQEGDTAPDTAGWLSKYHPVGGEVTVGEHAVVRLGDGWQWLGGRDGQQFLVDQGNLRDPSVAGVAVPPDVAESQVFTVFSYADEGHVEDDEPDYGELLESMKEDARAGSEQRRKAGLAGVELVGWAEPPHYDKVEHKLFWAKELRFDGQPEPVLNYNVRVLGRTGTVEINGVGGIEQLPLVAKHCKELLRVTEFVEGQRYSDFDPAYDKVAAYGIGGLIAGKVLLKTGLFAKLGILLVKFLKPILVGVAVLGAFLWKLIGGRSKHADDQVQPAVEE